MRLRFKRKARGSGIRYSTQVAADVRAQIISGGLAPGVEVVVDSPFKGEFNASTFTARHAVEALHAEGWLRWQRRKPSEVLRGRRKQNPFVAPPPPVFEAALCFDPVGDHWYELLEAPDEVIPPADVRQALGLADDGVAVLRKRRLWRRKDPMELNWSYYPAEVARGTELAERRKMRGGAVGAFERLGYQPHRCVDQLLARMATTDELELLKLPHEMPVLRTFRVTSDAGGHPLEVSVLVKPARACVMEYPVFVAQPPIAPPPIAQGVQMSDRFDEHEGPDPAEAALLGADGPTDEAPWVRQDVPSEAPSAEEQPAPDPEPSHSRWAFEQPDPIDRTPPGDPLPPARKPLIRDSTRRTVFSYGEEGFATWEDVERQRRAFDSLTVRYEEDPEAFAERLKGVEVLVWDRRYVLDGLPVALATSYVPRTLADAAAGKDLSDRHPTWISARLVDLVRGAAWHQEDVTARLGTDRELELLALPSDRWVTEIVRVGFDHDASVIEVKRVITEAGAYTHRYNVRA